MHNELSDKKKQRMKTQNNVNYPKTVPPDGGYGWVIAFAMALSSSVYVPLMQSSGLIFKDTFTQMGLSAAQGSLIINLHAAFGMLTGLLNGVFVKICSYRKAALLAAVFYFFGVTFTSLAESFVHFIICYGVIASLGVGLSRSAYGLALNTYFKKKRSKAMAFAMTIMAFGSILMPQLINLLIKIYTPQGVILILGGICAHFFVTALLLQPVKWHMKKEEEPLNTEEMRNETNSSFEENNEIIYNTDPEVCGSHLSLEKPTKSEENPKSTKAEDNPFRNIVKMFDLDLLKDPIFINILVGMALGVFSELNFSILIPFILKDYGLNTDQTATFISTGGVADLVFRFLAPYIGNRFKKSPRYWFVFTLIQLIILRSIFLFSSDFYFLLFIAFGLGSAKGIRRVYVGLIVPTHVSLEKLPIASGIEMMANGFCILTGGAILGVIRDVTGSYTLCIIVMNCVSLVTVIMWLLEAVIIEYRKTKTKKCQNEENIALRNV